MRLYQVLRRVFYRFVAAVPALIGVVVFTFILMRVMPGDPAIYFASGPTSGEEEIREIRRQLGLDKPLLVQLVYYLRDIATGDLGHSLTTGQAVTTDLIYRLPASLELTFFALLIALTLSVPLGVVAAVRPEFPHRSHCKIRVYSRGVRTNVRVRSHADLHLLLYAWLVTRSDRAF